MLSMSAEAAPNSGGSVGSDRSVRSDRSVGSSGSRLRPSGGYRELRSFQVSTIVYDATVAFCQRFVDRRSRTVDQMVQAARSGRQNIAEGSRAAGTSSQTELRLVNVARASLDELLLDYEDFLRQRGLRAWTKNDPEALAVRAAGDYTPWLTHGDPGIVANTVICLIHQTNYLLDQQIRALERDFIHEGGYSEQLAAARIAERRKQVTGTTAPSTPGLMCRLCGQPMVVRRARQGSRMGTPFLGCSAYPQCQATQSVENPPGP